MYNGHVVTYAQNREDIILSAFFDDNETGFYVDVGANDPINESVTKYFYDKGWMGINIEPIPRLYKKLCKSRPRDINLRVGVGSANGFATLHYYPKGDGLSTLSETMSNFYKDDPSDFTANEETYSIEINTLATILKKNLKNNSIQFMKIDVEGFELEVLRGNDWEKYRPEIICIEATHMDNDWRPLILDQGYALHFFDGLNEYYVDLSTDRAAKFDYTQKVIFKEPILNSKLLKDFKERDATISLLDSTNKLLKIENETVSSELRLAQSRIFSLQNELNQISSLKLHVKRSVKFRLRKADQKMIAFLTSENKYKPIVIENQDFSSIDNKGLLDLAKSTDKLDFDGFNKTVEQDPLLSIYMDARRALIKILRNTVLRKK